MAWSDAARAAAAEVRRQHATATNLVRMHPHSGFPSYQTAANHRANLAQVIKLARRGKGKPDFGTYLAVARSTAMRNAGRRPPKPFSW